MALKDIIAKDAGSAFLLANEAIVRGALEADVKMVAFYPGTPASEVLDTFSDAYGIYDYQMEIATNEKVALEICAGASFAGMRSLTAMKSVGTNVASDALFVLGYTGVRGGLVIVIADDPHAHSSQSEQDGRFFAPNAYIPMLEPSTAQEAKDMVKAAFGISESHRVPVIIRTVTRVNHQSGVVKLDEIVRKEQERVSWKSLNENYVTLGAVARKMKLAMLERTRRLEDEFNESKMNSLIAPGNDVGIITCSVAHLYALEALKTLGRQASILKLGTTYPFPRRLVSDFIKGLKTVVVVEELSPYLEKEVYALAKDANPSLRIVGKLSGHFSEALEYNPSIVRSGIAAAFGMDAISPAGLIEEANSLKGALPDRFPTFCAGCPHRATFIALSRAMVGKDYFFSSDIGCYSMWIFPPISRADSSLCMGASVGIANGISHAIKERVIAVVGDSTFFHAAIPGIVDAVHNGNKFTLIILDNSVTAMTGQQPNPSTAYTAGWKEGKQVSIEGICKALGIGFVEVIDAYRVKENVPIFRNALNYDGLSVVISRRECALYGDRNKRRRGEAIIPYAVDKELCRRPYACMKTFFCPAYEMDPDAQPQIHPEICDGCSVCSQLCAFGAIKRTGDKA